MEKFLPEQARKLAGFTQKEMASKLSISENAYINKEKGLVRFYVDEACNFCEIVGYPIERIIFLDITCHNNGTTQQ